MATFNVYLTQHVVRYFTVTIENVEAESHREAYQKVRPKEQHLTWTIDHEQTTAGPLDVVIEEHGGPTEQFRCDDG